MKHDCSVVESNNYMLLHQLEGIFSTEKQDFLHYKAKGYKEYGVEYNIYNPLRCSIYMLLESWFYIALKEYKYSF